MVSRPGTLTHGLFRHFWVGCTLRWSRLYTWSKGAHTPGSFWLEAGPWLSVVFRQTQTAYTTSSILFPSGTFAPESVTASGMPLRSTS
jgi:hypothetical protein